MSDESEKDLPATAEFTIPTYSMCNKVYVRENEVFNLLFESNISARVQWKLNKPEKLNPEKIKPLNLREENYGGCRGGNSKLPGSSGYDVFKFKAGKSSFFAASLTFVRSNSYRNLNSINVKVKISK